MLCGVEGKRLTDSIIVAQQLDFGEGHHHRIGIVDWRVGDANGDETGAGNIGTGAAAASAKGGREQANYEYLSESH